MDKAKFKRKFRMHYWRVSTTNRPVYVVYLSGKEDDEEDIEEIGQVTYIEGEGWYLRLWDVSEDKLRKEGFIGGESFLNHQGKIERDLMDFLERHGIV